MNKIILTIALLAFSTVSNAEVSGTIGFATTYTSHPEFKIRNNLSGLNAKLKYVPDNSKFGVIGSVTQTTGDLESIILTNQVEAKYLSVAAGPIYSVNEYFSIYGLVGWNKSDLNFKSSDDYQLY